MGIRVLLHSLMSPGSKGMTDINSPDEFKVQLNTLVEKLAEKVLLEVSDSNSSPVVTESIQISNNPNIGKLVLEVAPPTSNAVECSEGTKFLKAVVYTSDEKSKVSEFLCIGAKQEVVDFLNQSDTVSALEDFVKKADGIIVRDSL